MNEPKKNTPIGQGNSNLTHNQIARILPSRANPSYSESIKRYYVNEIRSLLQENKRMPVSEAFLMASRKIADPNPPDIETIYRWIKGPCSAKIDSISRVEWTHQNDSLPAPLSGVPLESVINYSELFGIRLHALKYGIATKTAHLSLFQDTHSQAIIDYQVGMYQPMDASFLSCMHRIARGGPGSLGKNSKLHDNWPARPMINNLFVPSGPEFMFRRIDASCNEAFIILHRHRGVYSSPACKIFVEIDRLLSRLAKGKKKGRAKVAITFEQLEQFACEVINKYNQKYQDHLNASPAQIFNNGIGDIVSRPILPLSYDPDKAFSIITRRRLTTRGIEYCGLYYNSPRLYLEYLKYIEKNVTIKVMPWDLSKIFVPTEKRELEVPAINASYTDGLSLDQHFAIRKVCEKGSRKAQFNRSVQPKNSGSPTTGSIIPFPNNP